MTPNATEFKWNASRERAAQMVADDRETDQCIADTVGISKAQLERWKRNPEFAARVQQHVEAWKERILKRGLAVKERRIESYNADFEATEVILRERGAELAEVCGGGSTGYIVRDYKGKDADRPVYMFDAALFRERRAIREQIADELGQLVKRSEITGKNGGAINITISADDERL